MLPSRSRSPYLLVYESDRDIEDFIDTIQRILKIYQKRSFNSLENINTFYQDSSFVVPVRQQQGLATVQSQTEQNLSEQQSYFIQKSNNRSSQNNSIANQTDKNLDRFISDNEEEDVQVRQFDNFKQVLELNIKTIEPEEYGMILYLVRQRDEDLVRLVNVQNSKSDMQQNLMPICVFAKQKLTECLALEFSKQELNLVAKNKYLVTTSIFTVFQRFRVEQSLPQFIKDLKRAISLDQEENLSQRSQRSSEQGYHAFNNDQSFQDEFGLMDQTPSMSNIDNLEDPFKAQLNFQNGLSASAQQLPQTHSQPLNEESPSLNGVGAHQPPQLQQHASLPVQSEDASSRFKQRKQGGLIKLEVITNSPFRQVSAQQQQNGKQGLAATAGGPAAAQQQPYRARKSQIYLQKVIENQRKKYVIMENDLNDIFKDAIARYFEDVGLKQSDTDLLNDIIALSPSLTESQINNLRTYLNLVRSPNKRDGSYN